VLLAHKHQPALAASGRYRWLQANDACGDNKYTPGTERQAFERGALGICRVGGKMIELLGEMASIDNFPRSAHAIANSDVELLAINKTDLGNILITDYELGFKLLWTFTKTLSKRLRETNEKMAGFLILSGGFNVFPVVRAGVGWYSVGIAVSAPV
jgi:hypothetical protein